MNASDIESVMWLLFGIIAIPTFAMSVIADHILRKEKKCSNHPSRSKSNTY
jgi:hypothetical protein